MRTLNVCDVNIYDILDDLPINNSYNVDDREYEWMFLNYVCDVGEICPVVKDELIYALVGIRVGNPTSYLVDDHFPEIKGMW